MEENLTMDDLKEELEESYKEAEEAASEEPAEELDPVWATLKQYLDEKTELTVKISSVVKAGVIAQLEGVRGFIPASRLSLEHVEDLNEWVGKKIQVRVITVEPEKKRLVLSAREILRNAQRAKRQEEFAKIQVGDVLKGKVETLKDYGAFIRLENGASGLVHVSQISTQRVATPAKVLKEGEEVTVKVIAIKDGKLSLSMKALMAPAENERPQSENGNFKLPKAEAATTNLGSLLAKLNL